MSTLRTCLLSFVLMAAGIGATMAQVAPSVGADPDPIAGVSPGDSLNLPLVFFPGDVTGILFFTFDIQFPVGVDPVLTNDQVNGNNQCNQIVDSLDSNCTWDEASRVLSVSYGSVNALNSPLDPFGLVEVEIDPAASPSTLNLTAQNINCELAQGFDPDPPCEGSNGQIQIGATTSPALAISPSSVFLPNTNDTATFTVENTGGTPLDLVTIALTNDIDFNITGGNCTDGFTLQANQANNCTVDVSFVGTPANLVQGALAVTTNTAGATPANNFAQFTGGTIPTGPALNIVEATRVAAPDATFTVVNTGGTDLNIATTGLAAGTDFSITGGTCTIGFTLLASQANNCTVIVSIVGTPTLVSNTLTVTTDTVGANPNTDSAQVTGGTAPTEPALNIVETSLPAAPDATFTVENVGGTDLNLATIGLATGTDFSITGGTCTVGFNLLASQANNCTVIVSVLGNPAIAVQDTLTVTTETANANPNTDSAIVSYTPPLRIVQDNLQATPDAPAIFEVVNTGNTDLVLDLPVLENGTDFVIDETNSTCTEGFRLLANQANRCTVVVSLVSDPATAVDDFLIVADNSGTFEDSATVTGGTRIPIAIPTLSQWSMMIVGTLLAMLAMVGLRRQS